MKRIVNFTPAEGLKSFHRREKGFSDSYTLFDLANHDTQGRPSQVAELRIYWGATTCYACAWVNHKYTDVIHPTNGSAKAGGYGYDKRESACRTALGAAGFEFDTNHQELRPEDALELIAQYFGLQSYFVHHSHA